MQVRYPLIVVAVVVFLGIGWAHTQSNSLDQSGSQWLPLEWSVEAPSVTTDHFDVIATVTFTHTSGESRQTEMFYAGENTWKFRFTATQTGIWTFNSVSAVPELNGLQGSAAISPNYSASNHGFVTHDGTKWAHSRSGRAFVPQFVMAGSPQYYYEDNTRIGADIQTFLGEHGFNGLHTLVFCRWFDIHEPSCGNITDPVPDFRTFDALEALIAAVYAQGGVVHIWMWGDSTRDQNPSEFWGVNSPEDLRLQRYIAARLGPLPGWTMGYGFDLFEWVSGEELTAWHDYMQAHMDWEHLLGARGTTNRLTQLSEAMDYSSYEQHHPDYDLYVETIEERPDKPSFSEDRFRIRVPAQAKDYTTDETRRGLWHSTMAGGVANIWGNLQGNDDINEGIVPSLPYENAHQIKTYALFFDYRFLNAMERCNDLTDGYCLRVAAANQYIFYKEDTDNIQLDLSGATANVNAVAVDTKLSYAEIDLGQFSPGVHNWQAPYVSDWAIAVGKFDPPPPPPTPSPTPTFTPTATATPTTVPTSTLAPGEEPPDPSPEVTVTVINLETPVIDLSSTPHLIPSPNTQTTSVDVGAETVSEIRPVFTWQPRTDNNGNQIMTDWYQIIVVDSNNQIVINTWLQADEICRTSRCIYTPDEFTLPLGFINGDYQWFLRVANGDATSAWVTAPSFSIDFPHADLPAQIQVTVDYVSPLIFTWRDDPKTAYYQLYLGTVDGTTILMEWYERADLACDGVVCTFIPVTTTWDQDQYYFYVRGWGPGGFSAGGLDDSGWDGITFEVEPPSAIKNPEAINNGDSQHLTWTAAKRATWYQVWLGTEATAETYHLQWYTASDLGCLSAETCSLGLALDLPEDVYMWYVQPWGPGGLYPGGIQGWIRGTVFAELAGSP